MKLQHLAVIFVIIIVPISLVMASYIQNQIDAIVMQTDYDRTLISATYDAVKAFQLNTVNNKYYCWCNSAEGLFCLPSPYRYSSSILNCSSSSS